MKIFSSRSMPTRQLPRELFVLVDNHFDWGVTVSAKNRDRKPTLALSLTQERISTILSRGRWYSILSESNQSQRLVLIHKHQNFEESLGQPMNEKNSPTELKQFVMADIDIKPGAIAGLHKITYDPLVFKPWFYHPRSQGILGQNILLILIHQVVLDIWQIPISY